jgi:hypothetical protein
MTQTCPISALTINMILPFQPMAMKQENEVEEHLDWLSRRKISIWQ